MYESSHDLDQEQSVASVLSKAWNCEFHKLPISYHVDWMLMREGKGVAFAELKSRKVPSTQYKTLMLSLSKWIKGNDLRRATTLPFLIIAKFTDGIFYLDSYSADVDFGIGGRTDRGDSQDIEPVVYMEIQHFKKVKQ
jgi:hypothetical protein